MKELQALYDEFQELKEEKSEINQEYKDVLSQSQEYQELSEELHELKLRKKELELMAQSQMGSRWDRIDDIKITIADVKDLMGIVFISNIEKNIPNTVVDKKTNKICDPSVSVGFKKTDVKNNDENTTNTGGTSSSVGKK